MRKKELIFKLIINYKKYYHSFLLIILFIHFIIPLIIFGHIGLIPHDSLETIASDYIISKLYKFNFDYIYYLLNGSYKWFFFETIFYPINILYFFLDVKRFFFVLYILKIIVGYFTFFLLLKKLKFTKFYSAIGGALFVTILSANHQSYFDLAFMPYMIYLLIKNKELKTKNYLIVFFFGLNGGLVHNIFSISLIPFLSIFVFERKNLTLIVKIYLTFIAGLFITDIHLFKIFFSEIPFHRVDMINSRPLIDLFFESLKLPFFEFNISGYHKIYRVFLILTISLSLILFLFIKDKTLRNLIILLMFVIFIRSFLGTNYFTSLFIGPLEALKGLNFMRVDRIIPLLTTTIIMFTLKNIKSYKFRSLFVILIMVSIIFQQLAITGKKFHSSIRSNIKDGKFAELKKFKKDKNILGIILFITNKNNFKNNEYNLGNDKYSWENYFHYENYKIIKELVGDNRVMSVGIDPLVAVMNDIKVIDGYHTLYYLHYKYKFRKIISEEIKDNEFLKDYFDGWGNRVYAFYNDKENLKINFLEAKKIGASFVISGFHIKNNNLKLIKKINGENIYIHSTSWQCYLCLDSDAFYLYKIIN